VKRGQDSVDYGIMVAAIVVVVLIVASYFGTPIVTWLANLTRAVTAH
jgi:Flp pilus assembly pilin Flp